MVAAIQARQEELAASERQEGDLREAFAEVEKADVVAQNEKKQKHATVLQLKEAVKSLEENKEATLAEAARIERELPGLEREREA